MLPWILTFLFFILLLVFGELATNIYLSKLMNSSHHNEDTAVNANVIEN